MAQKITGYIKLQIPAGKATPGTACRPCTGSAWCQHRAVHKGIQRKDC